MTDLEIVNVTAGGTLGTEIDPERVAADIPVADAYHSESILAAIIPIANAKLVAWRTGRVFVRGGDSVQRAHNAYTEFVDRLDAMGVPVDATELTIENVVCIGDMGTRVALRELARSLPAAEYEPEQFPGVVYTGDKAVSLVFSTGRVNIAGAPSRDAAEAEFQTVKSHVGATPEVRVDGGGSQ